MAIVGFVLYCLAILGVALASSRLGARTTAEGRPGINYLAIGTAVLIIISMGPAKTKLAEWGFPGGYQGASNAILVVLLAAVALSFFLTARKRKQIS